MTFKLRYLSVWYWMVKLTVLYRRWKRLRLAEKRAVAPLPVSWQQDYDQGIIGGGISAEDALDIRRRLLEDMRR